ncbi:MULTISPECIES: type I methionyl aminopeptidase [Rhizobium]|uniref:Methionine aminopeptidase n=2 Tax=Rhizobium TaxID=379 RepID=A0AAF1K2T3_9HYPH|nr:MULTISPECIES: type I methionyl aminopeptidase [Rhizobium]MBO9099125.1 type I methionyl aminopeptidase [Rhizobium sp. L58/93]MBO9132069.1 type I methionyl aminopeptidase [Rhizobium sp. B209b/85]MBO9169387.1 type I methionyl aminopeptidase [Rhizobium sp. L245/93]MBO9185339.1 type I methionyl aminopeptidase [Rhizobium sp. E27B/91]MBZ5758759.1 type I methionyl aminopeptidase [Rhizobium sp. VS19-DR96]
MIISSDDEFTKMKDIGRICANALKVMAAALEPGITTLELDAIGRKALEDAGARSAPETVYRFPGATCISVNEEVAHGIPGPRVIAAGDLVNLDVSAEKDGFFSDTGASFTVPPVKPKIERLCRDGKRALWVGLNQVRSDVPFLQIGKAVGAFAAKHRYTLIANLASHGIGRSLHEEPAEVSTWADPSETRIMQDGLVFTVEPFLSLGASWAEGGDDAWTLYSDPRAPTVQFEHTVIATRNGPVILTLADE